MALGVFVLGRACIFYLLARAFAAVTRDGRKRTLATDLFFAVFPFCE